MGNKSGVVQAMDQIKPEWRQVVARFKTALNQGLSISVPKYYMNSVDKMVEESVKNFKMRVRNLFREKDIEEALVVVDRYCKLTAESIKELVEPQSRKLLKDLIK